MHLMNEFEKTQKRKSSYDGRKFERNGIEVGFFASRSHPHLAQFLKLAAVAWLLGTSKGLDLRKRVHK